MSALVSGVAKLSPFKSSTREDDDEERGEQIDGGSISRKSAIPRSQLRVSPGLKSFLVTQNVLPNDDATTSTNQSEALKALLDKAPVNVPPSLTDRSHPLPDYFISSSHNTYLLAHQLYGTSNVSGYTHALSNGARCVEIDVWDAENNKEEPKVTHGFTLVSHVPFRSVCETIRDVVDKEASDPPNAQGYRGGPIFISLENHCSAKGQLRLVEIMKEVWGDRLLTKLVRDTESQDPPSVADYVRLEELESKICLIVEYHLAKEQIGQIEESEDANSETEEEKRAREEYQKKKQATAAAIIPELAELGVYAQSVKPIDNSWFDADSLINGPHHPLINLSETSLVQHVQQKLTNIARSNNSHLMRVYPKGTRISSANLMPVPFWNTGAHICALNWQTFGASVQLNEALFGGTDGYVLKPAALRTGGSGKLSTGRTKVLHLQIVGATDTPVPPGRDANDIKPYVSCTLYHPDDLTGSHPKRKTKPYKHHKIRGLIQGESSPVTDPIWDETLDWEYEENELVFLRIVLKSDDSFAKNPILAVAAVRLSYVASGWVFIRMWDLKGRETPCTLLAKFQFDDL
ncbi:hypothetical protein DV737_g3956, partial [Chaetothyriales sp. CBS 132003]